MYTVQQNLFFDDLIKHVFLYNTYYKNIRLIYERSIQHKISTHTHIKKHFRIYIS